MPDGIDKLVLDLTCDQIPEIKKQKLIGKGTYGSVYLFCTVSEKGKQYCDYVVKIQNILEPWQIDEIENNRSTFKKEKQLSYSIITQENLITNLAHDLGMAPKIHRIIDCGENFVILMDFIKGNSLLNLFNNKELKKEIIDKFFKQLKELHSNGLYHGDIKFDNAILDPNQEIIFIDFRLRNKNYKPVYDYAYLLYSLGMLAKNMNILMLKYIYSKIYSLIKNTSLTDVIEGMDMVMNLKTDKQFKEGARAMIDVIKQEIIDEFDIDEIDDIPRFY